MRTKSRMHEVPGKLFLILLSIGYSVGGAAVADAAIDDPATEKVHWSWNARSLAELIEVMEADLTGGGGLGDGRLEAGVPTVLSGKTESQVSAVLLVVPPKGDFLATGFSRIIVQRDGGAVEQVIELTEYGLTRTLSLTLSLAKDTLTIGGKLSFDDGTPTLWGGWTYSQATGAVADPASDAGFNDEVGRMLHAPVGTAAMGGYEIGAVIGMIGNIWTMLINYFLDQFITYEAPTSCDGPAFDSSCDGDDSPSCSEDTSDVCLLIDDIPDVSIEVVASLV